MKVFLLEVTLRAEWVHSLKEKRMILRSITQKLKNKFNISISETKNQDMHNIIEIGIVGIYANIAIADATIENIITYIEENTDAEMIEIQHKFIF